MTISAARKELEDLLAGSLGRDNFDELVRHVYESYSSVDLTDEYVRTLTADLEGAGGDEERELSEKLGILLVARGEYASAAEVLEPAKSRKAAAHFLGRACRHLDRVQEALQHLEHGRDGDHDLDTDVLIIETCCDLRDADGARAALKGYKKSDSTPAVLYVRGRVAELNGEYGEAMEQYEAALAQDDDHAPSLFRLALNCDLNGDDDRAIDLYRRCSLLQPSYVGPLMNLGVLYEDHGMYAEAIACYKRVLAIAPAHKRAHLYLKDAESSLSMYIDMAKSRHRQRLEQIFNLPVDGFELSTRSRTTLERRDIKTLGALAKVSKDDLLEEKNFGDTSLEEIEDLLGRYDLSFAGNSSLAGPEGQDTPEGDGEDQETDGTPIEVLELSTRCRRCMEKLGVKTVGELTRFTEQQLLATQNFGSTSLNELKVKLEALGLSLGSE